MAFKSLDIENMLHCGVYFLLLEGEIVYIGRSVNIYSRVSTHLYEKTKVFDEVKFIECDKKHLEELEYTCINKFKPRLNKVGGRFDNHEKFNSRIFNLYVQHEPNKKIN